MTTKPFVSIIINNYNYERFLADSIESALNQSYPFIEVIVVDDGSTDYSSEIISKYQDRIISIFQENGKQAAAFNSGFNKSKGDIIVFLDSDDYLFPNAVDEIVSVWKPDLSKVHYRLSVVDAAGESLGYTSPQGTLPLSSGKVWETLLQKGGYVSTPTSGNALNRKALEKLFPIPDEYKLTADDYLSYQVPFYGEVAAVETSLGAYRIHDSNQWALTTVSSAKFQRFVRHDLQNLALLKQKAKELGYSIPPDLEQRSIGRIWSRLISLRLEPKAHLVPSDNSSKLIYWGFRCLWLYSDFNLPKRLFYTIWFIWVGFMPLHLATPAIVWLYSPKQRPQFIDWTVNRARSLLN